ncbi:hypothetical protein D3C81_1611570 [compost metagenome]
MLFHFFPATALEVFRQGQQTVAGTDQARYGQADRFKHTTHFAVTTFTDGHAVPFVDAFTTAIGDFGELRQAVFQLYAGQQFLAHALFQLTQRTDRVFAIDTVARMHQAVRQITGSSKQQ